MGRLGEILGFGIWGCFFYGLYHVITGAVTGNRARLEWGALFAGGVIGFFLLLILLTDAYKRVTAEEYRIDRDFEEAMARRTAHKGDTRPGQGRKEDEQKYDQA